MSQISFYLNNNPATLLKTQFSISCWQNITVIYAMPNADNHKIDLKAP